MHRREDLPLSEKRIGGLMKVVMTGGGTAGHVNPALSIAEIIKSKEPGSEIEFIGTANGLEAKLVPAAGYNLSIIEVHGLRRSLSPKNIRVIYKAYTSYRECRKLLKKISPDVVIGTGGYVSWPVCRAAVSLKIPSILHEANAAPGFAVKALDGKADLIMVNFEETMSQLKSGKTEKAHVGMPINHKFYTTSRTRARKNVFEGVDYKYMVLSFGGSLGAEKINESVLGVMKNYVSKHPEIYFVHSTGASGYNDFMEKFKASGLSGYNNIKVLNYIYNMPEMMTAADIVICRSGASTMSELSAIGKPSILIPSPNVTNDQQYKNAKIFADKGAALLLKNDETTAETLEKLVCGLLDDPAELSKMSRAAYGLSVQDTEEKIFNHVREIIGR